MHASGAQMVAVPSWHYEELSQVAPRTHMPLQEALTKCYDLRRDACPSPSSPVLLWMKACQTHVLLLLDSNAPQEISSKAPPSKISTERGEGGLSRGAFATCNSPCWIPCL